MGEGAADHLGLLVDLLRHEVAVVALVDQEGLGGDFLAGPGDDGAGLVADLGAVPGQDGPVALLQIADLVREGGEREGVGAEIGLAVAEAQGQRGAVAGADQEVLLAGEQEGEREGAAQARQRRLDGRDGPEAGPHQVADELGHHLGVGLGLEGAAGGLELGLQLAEILDDAVVDHREALGGVRVGVGLVGAAMRRPAGVADADGAGEGVLEQLELEVRELALSPPPLQAAGFQGGDARRVVAAILEPAQGVDHLSRHGTPPDDSHDAAHARRLASPLGTVPFRNDPRPRAAAVARSLPPAATLPAFYRTGRGPGQSTCVTHCDAGSLNEGWPGSRGAPSRPRLQGIITVLMTWITPFDCMTSPMVTLAVSPFSSAT
ncbi:hypothetical protein OPKNFCMD_2729 [Methylobacterium crusticola]|uniref:Uncharacterized protein n=1 Tax=Methylobacterium crusticola TaxID=1697972 RepID=A0ABQ4QX97_9HYPH|nr:hypothetical protein OPKNFCMD_2729 [Methylobacterium crusticola]